MNAVLSSIVVFPVSVTVKTFWDIRGSIVFCSFSISELERIERLEQLRALSNNLKLKVVLYDGNPIKGVDTLEDLNLVREMMIKK